MTEPLLRFLTRWVILIIEDLRARHRHLIVSAIHDPAGCTPDGVRAMLRELARGEARLWREITEGAMRELGVAYRRLPLSAYAREAPRSWPELRNRLLVYQRMLRDPEACVRRLIARLRPSRLQAARAAIKLAAHNVVAVSLHAAAPRSVAPAHPAIHPP
jgi:hypothetical protein